MSISRGIKFRKNVLLNRAAVKKGFLIKQSNTLHSADLIHAFFGSNFMQFQYRSIDYAIEKAYLQNLN
jgi:hypothetical protein